MLLIGQRESRSYAAAAAAGGNTSSSSRASSTTQQQSTASKQGPTSRDDIVASQLETCSSMDDAGPTENSALLNFFTKPDDRLQSVHIVDAPDERPDIRQLAAPLSKEQLISIIVTAASMSNEVSKLVQDTACASPAARRLMIRNIHYVTTDTAFTNHFAQFGLLEEAAIVREKCGRSKGFGFVTFRDMQSMQRCLTSALQLDGRKLFVKVAADPFSEFLADGAPVQGRSSRRKIFVRNLPLHCDVNELKEAFAQFGPVEDCSIVYDPHGKSRGFAFVTYYNQKHAVKAAAEPQQTFSGRVIFVSFAKSGCSISVDSPPPAPGRVEEAQRGFRMKGGGKDRAYVPRRWQLVDEMTVQNCVAPRYSSPFRRQNANVLYEPWTQQAFPHEQFSQFIASMGIGSPPQRAPRYFGGASALDLIFFKSPTEGNGASENQLTDPPRCVDQSTPYSAATLLPLNTLDSN